MRYLGYTSLSQVDMLTIPEFELLMEGVRIRNVDEDYRNHLQAYLNFVVQAEKKVGKKSVPVYKKFKQFYDYEKEVEKVTKPNNKKESRFAGIGKLLKKGE